MFEATRLETSSIHTPARTEAIRVLTVPSRHPYISAITPSSVAPIAPDRTLNWEPDSIFEPGAVRAMCEEIDVIHIHFSFDHLDPVAMRAWLDEVKASRIPLVVTVHDLRNPHHSKRHFHDNLLAELVPAADAVITLTDGAAEEIAERFGVTATVIPHPSLVDSRRSSDVETELGLVVLNLKYLRSNIRDHLAIVEAAKQGAADAGGRLLVNALPKVLDEADIDRFSADPEIDLEINPPFSDVELERFVRRAHVMVLPYRWGSHSGWLELARDLGTRVVAPDCGYFGDQWSEIIDYTNNESDGLDAESLRKAVAYALESRPPAPADQSQRTAEADAARHAHEVLYRQVMQ